MGKALEKFSFSITDDGHKWDAKVYKEYANASRNIGKASKEYEGKRPFLADINGINSRYNELIGNKMDYSAAKHESGKNDWNPFAGFSKGSADKLRKRKRLENK